MNEHEWTHRDPEELLDQVLRREMRWQAPPDLTERLVGMVGMVATTGFSPATSSVVVAEPLHPRPGRWYSILVMLLTAVAVGVSFAVAWQFYGIVGAELGLSEAWNHMQALVSMGLHQLYGEIPALRHIMTFIGTLYEQASWLVNWVLLAVVLWLVFDSYTPGTSAQRQQSS